MYVYSEAKTVLLIDKNIEACAIPSDICGLWMLFTKVTWMVVQNYTKLLVFAF